MTARLYSHLADACVGLAGAHAQHRRREHLTRALAHVENAFNHYSAVEDVARQCEMLAKKATIMKVAGDNVLANDYAAAYLALRREAVRERA